MTFDELDIQIRERIKQQPRGFQADLASKLGVTRQYISHVVSSRSPISREHYQTILDMLGLQLDLKPGVSDAQ